MMEVQARVATIGSAAGARQRPPHLRAIALALLVAAWALWAVPAGPAAGAPAPGPALSAGAPAALDIDKELLCTFDTSVLPEVSGLASSRIHEDVVWAVNDSLNGPFLYALATRDCRIVAKLTLVDAPDRDYEGLAAGTDADGRAVLWVGDIGNNDGEWPDVRIQKVIEPERLRDADVTPVTYRFTYPGGPVNAEALVAAPDREQLWVVSKQRSAGGEVYQLPSPLRESAEPMIAPPVGPARTLITDGAMAPDGKYFVLRDYFSAEVFQGEPPGLPVARFRLPIQFGGEAVTWTADGQSILIAAEGSGDLIRVTVPAVALGKGSWIAEALPRVAGFDIYPYVRLFAILVVGALGLVLLVRRASRRRRTARLGASTPT